MKLSRILMIKMNGEDVKFLQTKLKEYGFYRDRVDGVFNQNTLLSVFNFQKKFNIKSDGTVGMQMWSYLINYDNIIKKSNEQITLQNKLEIPNFVSYSDENGLCIYDQLLNESEYYKEQTHKSNICLDITFGGSRPDWTISKWNNDNLPKAAHFVIGRNSSSLDNNIWDGKILKSFDDKYWSEYIKINDKEINKNSIIISLCNYGNLTLGNDGIFYNIVSKPINEKDVIELDYMGYKYWEKITDFQIENLRLLIKYLSNRWSINIKHVYNNEWFESNSVITDIKTHMHYSGQISLFPQKEVIDMLNSL
jgi:N-acetyl-anhydromuramyl-L-alanine amidase AmpD